MFLILQIIFSFICIHGIYNTNMNKTYTHITFSTRFHSSAPHGKDMSYQYHRYYNVVYFRMNDTAHAIAFLLGVNECDFS
jgi:hypothetical protein